MATTQQFRIANPLHMKVEERLCVLSAGGTRLAQAPKGATVEGNMYVVVVTVEAAKTAVVTLEADGQVMLVPMDFVGADGNIPPSVATTALFKSQMILAEGNETRAAKHTKVHEHFRELEKKWKAEGDAGILWQSTEMFQLTAALLDDLIEIRASDLPRFDRWVWGDGTNINKPVVIALYYLAALYVKPQYRASGRQSKEQRWGSFQRLVPEQRFQPIRAWVERADTDRVTTSQVAQYLEEFIEKYLVAYEQGQP